MGAAQGINQSMHFVLIVVVLLVVEVEFIYAMCVCKVVKWLATYFEKLLLLLASRNEDYDLKQHTDSKYKQVE